MSAVAASGRIPRRAAPSSRASARRRRKAAATARIGIRRSSTARARPAPRRRAATSATARPRPRRLRCAPPGSRSGAHLAQRRHQRRSGLGRSPPGRGRARRYEGGDERKRRRGRVGRDLDGGRPQFRLAVTVMRRPAPSRLDLYSAPTGEHALRVVARRLLLDDGALRAPPGRRAAPRIEPREATGGSYTIGIGSRAPASVSGNRPPARRSAWREPHAPSGSSTRCIGRLRSEASPLKVAVTGEPPTAHRERHPVPELRSRAARPGLRSRRRPRRGPSRRRRALDLRAERRMALAVLTTSSPSSRPVIRVSADGERAAGRGRGARSTRPGYRRRPARVRCAPSGTSDSRGVRHGAIRTVKAVVQHATVVGPSNAGTLESRGA